MARVDVLIPCYNYGRFLQSCVGSVLSQEGCEVRLLIIDDASPDGSAAEARRLAAADGRIELIAHPQNKGHIATYNEAIEWARSDYLTLLSADDLLSPGALARAVAALETQPQVGFVAGPLTDFHDEDELAEMRTCLAQLVGIQPRIVAGADFIRRTCESPGNPIPASGVVVRTGLQKAVGGYRPELPHAGDLEMWLRLAAKADLAVLDVAQSFTRRHRTNMREQYYQGHRVADFRQRRLMFELFFKGAGAQLPDAARLAQLAQRSLGREAVWSAYREFDRDDLAASTVLAGLAAEIDPAVVWAPTWWKLAVKRRLGPRMCRALWSPFAAARS